MFFLSYAIVIFASEKYYYLQNPNCIDNTYLKHLNLKFKNFFNELLSNYLLNSSCGLYYY